MTIKKRLFISNILMIVIPVVIGIVVVTAASLVVNIVIGTREGYSQVAAFRMLRASEQVQHFSRRWADLEDPAQVIADVEAFNNEYAGGNVSVTVYMDEQLLYPQVLPTDKPIWNIAAAQSEAGSHFFLQDDTVIHMENIGRFRLMVADTDSAYLTMDGVRDDYQRHFVIAGIVLLAGVAGIILLTNRFLTRFVFNSVMNPVDALVYGVHQLRDGNLEYRIDYPGEDEFAGVCADFNEMAERLLDSVNARQKDEASRKELIAGIAHDLRTPLTSIKAYAEGIAQEVAADPETRRRYLEVIMNKTADLEHVVNQLFLFSKIDIGEFPFHFESVEVGKEMTDFLNAVSEEYARKGLIISADIAVPGAHISADLVQFRNAIINVLENSTKYKQAEQGHMQVVCREEGEQILITLADDGPGLAEPQLEQIFEVFYRGDPARNAPGKGSGLGLSITAKIIERHGGTIRAQNVPTGGLAVIMTIPKEVEVQ
jgi:signal transduction histidine kinase